MRSYWIVPAAAIVATLFFSPSAKADKWGFSARVSYAGDGYRRAPRVVHHKNYRYSSRSHCGDNYYYDRAPRYYRHSGRRVYRSGHGRYGYSRERYYDSRARGRYYRGHRSYR